MVFESHQALQHVSTPKERTRVVVVTTDPYRVPSERGTPFIPLSLRGSRFRASSLASSAWYNFQVVPRRYCVYSPTSPYCLPSTSLALAGSIGLSTKGVRRDFVTGGPVRLVYAIQARMHKGGARRLAETGATAKQFWR